METIYRKVTFEIEQQDHCKTVLIGKNANFIFNPNTRNGEELSDFLSGCEEIPDPTAQLKADKEELLEMLKELKGLKFIKHSLGKNPYYLENQPKAWEKVDILIQKHKQ